MFSTSVNFPGTFGEVEFLVLTEPSGKGEKPHVLVDRLYMIAPSYEGGKILLKEVIHTQATKLGNSSRPWRARFD